MSNAYINQILFHFPTKLRLENPFTSPFGSPTLVPLYGIAQHSKTKVDAEYIRGLSPLMLTEERLSNILLGSTSCEIEPPSSCPPHHPPNPLPPVCEIEHKNDCEIEPKPDYPPHPPTQIQTDFERTNKRFQHQSNTLFWSIYEVENPTEAFLGTKANAEVEHRLKVVAELKKTPKRLKETNSKLTAEQTQGLMGAMLVAKEDKIDFCIAYAAYYNKPIVVVYQQTYCVFSPTIDVDLEDEDVILLYATKPESAKRVVYSSEKNLTREMVKGIVQTKIMGPLKAMSNYKNPDLDELAAKMNIAVKYKEESGKEKRRKKEDIYNDIKLAIHKDQYGS